MCIRDRPEAAAAEPPGRAEDRPGEPPITTRRRGVSWSCSFNSGPPASGVRGATALAAGAPGAAAAAPPAGDEGR
eukprot:9118295-Alexandrium_andersonii.AAC.1